MRRFLLLGAVMAVAVPAAGCGGATGSATHSEAGVAPKHSAPVERTVTEAPPPPPSEEVGGPLENVGTITAPVAAATTFSDHFLLGPLLYSDEGTPPEAVLNACGVNSPSIIARSVFARGQVTIRYTEGSLPTPLGINFTEVVRGRLNGRVALRIDGEWQCENVEGFSLEFEPGESKTFPLWVIALTVLSNAEPRVSKEVLDTWHFDPIGVYNAEESESRVYGPGTGRCENEYENEWYMLLLYNRSGHC